MDEIISKWTPFENSGNYRGSTGVVCGISAAGTAATAGKV